MHSHLYNEQGSALFLSTYAQYVRNYLQICPSRLGRDGILSQDCSGSLQRPCGKTARMCVCVYVYVYIYIYILQALPNDLMVKLHACTYVCTYVCMYVCIQMHTMFYMYVRMYACIQMHTYFWHLKRRSRKYRSSFLHYELVSNLFTCTYPC